MIFRNLENLPGLRVCLKLLLLTYRGAKGRNGEGRKQKCQLKLELQLRILPSSDSRLPTFTQLSVFIQQI
jgi:hypothetical protein